MRAEYALLLLILLSACSTPPEGEPEKTPGQREVANSNAPNYTQEKTENLSREHPEEKAEERTPERRKPYLNSTLLWSFNTSSPISDVEIGEHLVALASYDNNFYILNREGKLLHRLEARGNAQALALSEESGLMAGVSFVHPMATLYIYSLEEKPKLIWKKELEREIRAIDFLGRDILAGDASGKLTLFSPEGGVEWNFSLEKSAWGVWEVETGREGIAVASDDTNLYYLSPEGELIWRRSMGRKHYLYGSALEEELELLGAASQEELAMLYTKEGRLLWKFKTNFSNSDIAISPLGLVAVASWDGHVYLLSARGELIDAIEAEEPTSLNFYKNYLAFSSRDGNVYFYRLEGKGFKRDL